MSFEEEIQEIMKLGKKVAINIMKDEEFTDAIAEYYWNMFNSLKKKGFDSSEAMNIVSNMKLPEAGLKK